MKVNKIVIIISILLFHHITCLYIKYRSFHNYITNYLINYRTNQLSNHLTTQLFNTISSVQSINQTSHFYSQKSFNDFNISSKINQVLLGLNINKPSKIQSLSYNHIVNGKSCIVADQTGSGKTLAYLLPIIQRMYDNKYNKAIVNNQLNNKIDLSPAIVVIAPTNELANQISQVVKSISSILRFRSISLTSSSKIDNELTRYNLGCDILIATPGRLLSYLQNKQIDISNSKTVVLDEVDVLYMDETYPLQGIGEFIPDSAQYLFITATLPDQTSKQIVREFSTIDRQILVIKGPGLHRIPPTIEEILIDCSIKQSNDITYRRNKWNKMIDSKTSNKRDNQIDDDIGSDINNGMESRIDRYIDEDQDTDFESVISKEIVGTNRFKGNKADRYIDDKTQQKRYAETVLENKRQALVTALSMNYLIERTIIFCNTIEQCRFVENSLLRVDRHKSSRDIYSYHSAIDRVIRDENLEKFSKKLLVKPVVLICTDRASRGIDFNQINVDHVILFDFPQEPSEYVRRVGRTGRAGRFGKVSILAHGRQIDVITNLLVASKQGKRIEPIPSLNGIQSYSKE